MKQLIYPIGLGVVLMLLTGSSIAKPKAADNCYWVVQDQIDGRTDAYVRFYNDRDSLIFEQNFGRRTIELDRKIIKKLNRALRNFKKRGLNEGKFMITGM